MLLCIVLFFVLLFSVKFRVTIDYDDETSVLLRWLFLKIQILPAKEKKPKKEKKKKPKKEEPPKDEKVPAPKEKKDNIIKRFYNNKGLSGLVDLLKSAVNALGGMFGRVFKAFIFDELYVSVTVGTGDSAETAIKYGKTCAVVFPLMGYIVSNMRAKKYNCEVTPDFIHGENSARAHATISVRPISITNALVIVAFELLFKVVIKLLKGSKVDAGKGGVQTQNNNQQIQKGGQTK